MKVAVCLFVKNEVLDILPWLAWYHVLGADACIVYDDYSDDGTWEALNAAAKVQDVRLSRSIGERSTHHTLRQDACYIDAVKKYSLEFDWIGFFDADEYIRLFKHRTLQEFLATFPQQGAIVVHWCLYGSNYHAFRPNLTPLEAYTRHSTEALVINRHVKSFLHLASWQGGYFNMHAFDVRNGTTLDSVGKIVQWSDIHGVTKDPPIWEVAMIMHYQCRSMEQYLKRLRERPHLVKTTQKFYESDTNDVEEVIPVEVTSAMLAQLNVLAP